jgi:very-short-patch-repair endonuclease
MPKKLLLQNVWWPLFDNFDDLHPEYEVYDWNRKSQFLWPGYSLNRDTFLSGLGWRIIHFSFDDVQRRKG